VVKSALISGMESDEHVCKGCPVKNAAVSRTAFLDVIIFDVDEVREH